MGNASVTHQSEDELIRETAQRYLRENYTFSVERMSGPLDPRSRRRTWTAFAEMGWLGLPFPESEGGFGASPTSIAALCSELGRALVVESYLGGVLLPGNALATASDELHRALHLQQLIEGRTRYALAHEESGWSVGAVKTTAKRVKDGYRLTGSKKFVLAGADADVFIISAHIDSESDLFIVARDAVGFRCRPVRAIDGSFVADLQMDNVEIGLQARLGNGAWTPEAASSVRAAACAAACSDAVGAMQAMLDRTVAYTATRQQFGQSLSTYQVLQHRMARMAIHCEEGRAAALYAALRSGSSGVGRERAISGAKAKIGTNGRWVAQQAIQLHGGIGMTSELDIGWYAKRLLMFENTLGTTREHLGLYAALLSDRAIGVYDVLSTE